jgi:hypothetical protein
VKQRVQLRRKREAGATIVEAGVILAPFLAMFFALMDFSMAIFMKNTMQFAVRQGARFAVTSQVEPGLGHDNSIKNVVQTNAFGFLTYLAPTGEGRPCSGQGCIHIDYFDPITMNLVSGANSNAGGNIVQISVESLSWAWMVPLMRSSTPLSFSVSSADVMEASPVSGIPAR